MTKAGINLRSLRYRPGFAQRLILTGLHYDRRIVETVPNSSFRLRPMAENIGQLEGVDPQRRFLPNSHLIRSFLRWRLDRILSQVGGLRAEGAGQLA